MNENKAKAQEAALRWWRSPQSRMFWDGRNPQDGEANCENCGQPISPLQGYLCKPQKLVCEECFDTHNYIAYESPSITSSRTNQFEPSLRILPPKKWWEFWKK
ncbi:MAG: hypothetical protein HYZ49_03005 [Chloroflexi bacterium]|nr:hypothetical protein [Chloroflexota bacterium]